MTSLTVRKIDDKTTAALKLRAGGNGGRAEAEHRPVLEGNVLFPAKKTFAQIIATIPKAGREADFRLERSGDREQNVNT